MGVMDEEFEGVSQGSGEYATMNGLTGHLVIVFPIGYVEHSPTKFSVPGKRSDVIICDVVDLDDVDEHGQPGKVYRGQWWRGAFLIAGLRQRIGGKVLGRLGKGVAKNGMNPPWVITDMVADGDCLARAKTWGQLHAAFRPSEFQPPSAMPAPTPPPPSYAGPAGYPQAPQQQSYPSSSANGGYGQHPGGYPQDPYQQQQPGGYPPASYPDQQPGGYPPAPGGYGQPPQAGYAPPRFPVAPSRPTSQDDVNMLEQMRQRAQTAGYSNEPPF